MTPNPTWHIDPGVLDGYVADMSATASTMGDRTAGGIAGALFSMACFATTFLPSRTWLPLPPNPDAPGATSRLLAVLSCAIAVLAWVSRDPVRRRLLSRTTGRGTVVPRGIRS